MARRMFPSARFHDAIYAAAVQSLDQSAAGNPQAAQLLSDGVADLDARAGGSFVRASADAQTAVLRKIESTPFFKTVRATTVVAIYNNPAVWAAIGYEGGSYSKGGYQGCGFDDIDWLPS